MDWEAHYQLWREARQRGREDAHRQLKAVARQIAQYSQEDLQWLISALEDDKRKWFVAGVFGFKQLPERLFVPMLRAGVLERDPSNNLEFIRPCVLSYGATRVCTALLEYLETGSNEEKAGAVSALYWARGLKPDEDMSEIDSRTRVDMLQEFVNNEDLRVRRRIIPALHLEPQDYPPELHPLIERAIEIARAHPDEYIRHRVEVQLGRPGPLMAIPDDD